MTSPRVNPDAGHHPEETSATDAGNHPTLGVPQLGHWGDPMANIADDTIRILYQNVNGLSTSSSVYEEVKPSNASMPTCFSLTPPAMRDPPLLATNEEGRLWYVTPG